MNKQELIKEFEEIGIDSLNIFGTEVKSIPTESEIELIKQLDEPEPLPFKLKDVVRRIRGFDPTTQTRWLNDILKELGDDYGSMKYRSGYEQGKLEGAWVGNQLKDADKIRQELNKPVIPKFAADFIAEQKKLGHTLSYSIDSSMSDRVAEWYWDNSELFALAWLFGYEVEEEKRYLVKIKGNIKENMLVYGEFLERYFFTKSFSLDNAIYSHTRKELEEAGFGRVFDFSSQKQTHTFL